MTKKEKKRVSTMIYYAILAALQFFLVKAKELQQLMTRPMHAKKTDDEKNAFLNKNTIYQIKVCLLTAFIYSVLFKT